MSVTGEKDLEQDLSDERAAGDVGSVQEDINPNGAQRPEGEAEEDVEEDEDEEDKEPNLKYTRLTPRLSSVYRNGDSTSSFQVSGDKMIIGTHNGNVHVLSAATFQSLRLYHAHSSSITAISVSPFSPSVSAPTSDPVPKPGASSPTTPAKPVTNSSASTSSPKGPRQAVLPATPSNSIYIATASIDGHVCVSSLIDAKDVTLRNYARPVQAVALSPQYKTDRTYLSGGTAGSLILTVGGRPGVSADANTNSTAAAASGWLGAIGLGSNTGKDTILHSGEGNISSIKWSNSGRHVVWVNEQGSKIMRSNLYLESGAQSDLAWKRIAHIPRPNRRSWEDMAGVWKARTEWIDEKCLEFPESMTPTNGSNGTNGAPEDIHIPPKLIAQKRRQHLERLLIGWGDTVWMVHVTSARHGSIASAAAFAGKAEIVHQVMFPDSIISGLTLYTPSLLLALVYRTRDDNDKLIQTNVDDTPKRGVRRRQNGLAPDLRLIDLDSPDKDEVEVEGLNVSRFESLSMADYHMSSIYVPSVQMQQASQKGALEVIGGGIWDVGVLGVNATLGGVNATLGATLGATATATRLFSSGASVLSGSSEGDKTSVSTSGPGSARVQGKPSKGSEILPQMGKPGLKIFIQSPYDCVLAIKRDLSDRLSWLLNHEHYKHAWELVDTHPEIVSTSAGSDSQPSTPSKTDQTLGDFFADEATSENVPSVGRAHNSGVEKEKRRIGDLWVEQLVASKNWELAGATAGKVLGTASSWEHWILAFAQANKFDEITPFIPTQQLKPPLPSHVFEVVLGYYISQDRERLQDLLDRWDPDLFDVQVVAATIESKLNAGDVQSDTVQDGVKGRDWHILHDCLAKLYLADSRPAEALQCYIRTQHADAAFTLIRDYQLIDSISDTIYEFVVLRIPREKLINPPLLECESLSLEAIHLLAAAAVQGVIPAETVVQQLEAKGPKARPFLFFYIRALWQGDTVLADEERVVSGPNSRAVSIHRSRFDAAADSGMTSKALLAPLGDLTVSLFADYSRPLLVDYLKSSEDYTYEHASAICERYHYIPELVHLLSATGQTKRALHLIIDEIGDVMMAIKFAKEIDEDSLWGDLLDYSMSDPGRPTFIRGLLEEVGTSIDPVTLVRRIPEGLEIEGLKHGLGRLVRESEIMWSISEGAGKVLRSEVVDTMEDLRKGRTKGVMFDVPELATPTTVGEPTSSSMATDDRAGCCETCKTSYTNPPNETGEYLLGFPCGHIFHLACLLDAVSNDANKERINNLQKQFAVDDNEGSASTYSDGKVGNKMARAQMIRGVLGEGGCLVCEAESLSGRVDSG